MYYQNKNRPVRIKTQNKELWEKEAKLYRRWSKLNWAFIALTLITFVLIWPSAQFRSSLPWWFGYFHLAVLFTSLFATLFCNMKCQIHECKYYEYKYGKQS